MRVCAHCGTSLDGHRRQARYCGGPCRAAASRTRAAERSKTVSGPGAQRARQKRTEAHSGSDMAACHACRRSSGRAPGSGVPRAVGGGVTHDLASIIAVGVISHVASELGVDPEQLLGALSTCVASHSADAAQDGPTGTAMSVKEVADRIGRDHQAVRRAIERGDLVAYKVCGCLNIYESDYQAWHAACRASPGEQRARDRWPSSSSSRRRPTNGLVQLLEADDKET